MMADPTLLQKKYARVIERYATKYDIDLQTALGHFYHSMLYQLMREGVSDLHCMSDEYLVEELEEEQIESCS